MFIVWYGSERTLSIHSIHIRRRELFYWAKVLTTFALGTAAGDLTAITLHLGFVAAGVVFAIAIAIPAVGHGQFGLNPILSFWFAYILTRPLGASFADWVALPPRRRGLGWGTGPGQPRPDSGDRRTGRLLAVTGKDVETSPLTSAHR